MEIDRLNGCLIATLRAVARLDAERGPRGELTAEDQRLYDRWVKEANDYRNLIALWRRMTTVYQAEPTEDTR
jgi:hypothetical protein